MAAEEVKTEEAAPAAVVEEVAAPPAEEVAPPPPAEEAKAEEAAKVEEEVAAPPAKEEKPPKVNLQQKALEEFKIKVEEAIKANGFVPPPPPPPKVEEESPKVEEESPKVEGESPAAAAATEEAPNAAEEVPPPPKEEEVVAVAPPVAAEEVAPPPKVEEVPEVKEDVVKEAEPEVKEAAPEVKEEEKPVVVEEAAEPEEVFLWGIPLAASAGDERTDVILTKFLQARDFKVPAALTMLKNTVLWRKSYKADEILDEAATDESAFEAFSYMSGVDKEGHPVCYNVFGALQNKELYAKVVDDSAKFIRWRVGLQEKGIKLLKFEPSTPNSLLQVIDLKNSPWPAKNKVRLLIGQAVSLLQDNYPELVVKNVFINVPWYYTAVYSIISPFLTQRQKQKFVVARPAKSAEALFKFISPENVPLQYGGLARASDDTAFAGAEAPPTDLVLKMNEKKTIELPVTMSNATVTWDVVVIGYDVTYAAEFQPDKEGGYTTIIEKTKKVLNDESTDDKPIRSSFTTSEPGKVVLTIENLKGSKKKLLVYRYIVKAAST